MLPNSKDIYKVLSERFTSGNLAMSEFQLQLINLKKICRYSNANIIRDHTDILGYGCFFCKNRFPDPADLKKHTKDHVNPQFNLTKNSLKDYRIKMDTTGLKCKLCDKNVENTGKLMDHLVTMHDEKLYQGLKNYIMEFKFDANKLICSICSKERDNFKSLLEHMNPHYRNFVCNICDTGFINTYKLSAHKATHKKGSFKCGLCSKIFDTKFRMKQHERIHSDKKLHRCRLCDETFKEHRNKLKHLVEKHGQTATEYNCLACDKIFSSKHFLNMHTRKDHLMERPFECDQCHKKFGTKAVLQNHMYTHLVKKIAKCEVCNKSYANFKSLKEHMKIHNNDRRWKCEHCAQTFVQKCSLKGHMKSKHDLIL